LEKYYQVNLKRWNELVDIHAKSRSYNLRGFLEGETSLHSLELEALGDVNGKSLLHLQCHFGLDTLSWARLGAQVTGVDFSSKAINMALKLAQKTGLAAEFICCNIYDLTNHLERQFDIVYSTYGVITWLHDLGAWASIIARYLKPKGQFFLAEFHPFMWVFDDEHPSELRVRENYWQNQKPTFYEAEGTYVDTDARVKNTGAYEWAHPMSEIVNSLINAGLVVKELKEYPFSVDRHQLAFMEKGQDGYARLPGYNLPLMYSITATKVQH
jgi:2-polyprenyl-3-methyl-5-hydroxy-6-metoxy-1,4-benzoquinol methylase